MPFHTRLWDDTRLQDFIFVVMEGSNSGFLLYSPPFTPERHYVDSSCMEGLISGNLLCYRKWSDLQRPALQRFTDHHVIQSTEHYNRAPSYPAVEITYQIAGIRKWSFQAKLVLVTGTQPDDVETFIQTSILFRACEFPYTEVIGLHQTYYTQVPSTLYLYRGACFSSRIIYIKLYIWDFNSSNTVGSTLRVRSHVSEIVQIYGGFYSLQNPKQLVQIFPH